MSQIIPKYIGEGSLGAYIIFTNSIPIITFGYVIYENANIITQTYDSANNFVTFTPLSEFTYTYIIDQNSQKYIQVTVECGNHTFIFNDGEYYYGDYPLNLYDVVNGINTALGF